MLAPALAEPGLRAVVMLGLAGGRARVALERVGLNVMDYRQPDNRGDVVRGEPCVGGGPPAYWSTLPLPAILDALNAEGIPAYLSNTAGTFLCNYTLYTALHALAAAGRRLPAGFIHLPYLPSMVASHGLEEPSMDLALMVHAAEIAATVALAT
jgi:pyroglutamyl-peptidase